MKNYSIYDIRKLNESYQRVLEAQSRATSYKNLTPEQAEELAKYSPSYKSEQIWGNTSNWICSTLNRLIKYQHITFETCLEIVRAYKRDIDDFEKFQKVIGKDISTVKSFEELANIVDTAKKNGKMETGLSDNAKTDGRARQCYSLMKNGKDSGDFSITYEDNNWIIGYPHSLEYNRKFSAIGKWCHTGSFGDAERYWSMYASTPIYYILSKVDGTVYCASFNNREIRDQKDAPADNADWNGFWTSLGLKTPMVDEICDTENDYDVPDDVEYERTEDEMLEDLYDRVDMDLISDQLFNGMENGLELESDNLPSGTVYFNGASASKSVFGTINPYVDSGFLTKYEYDDDIDTNKYLTFDEFVNYFNSAYPALDSIIESDKFQLLWTEADAMDVTDPLGIKKITFHDNRTMESRIPYTKLKDFLCFRYRPKDIDPSKYIDIKDCFSRIERIYSNSIQNSLDKIFKLNEFSIYFSNNDEITITLDADEAMTLAQRLRDTGEPSDILKLAMKNPSDAFAVERPIIDDYYIEEMIGKIKGICIATKESPRQMNWDNEFNSHSMLFSTNGRYS